MMRRRWFLNQIIPLKIIALPLRQMTAILLKLRLHSKPPPHNIKGFPVRAKWVVSQRYHGLTQVHEVPRGLTQVHDPSSDLSQELADLSMKPQKQPSSSLQASLLRSYSWHKVWKRKGQEKTLVVWVHFPHSFKHLYFIKCYDWMFGLFRKKSHCSQLNVSRFLFSGKAFFSSQKLNSSVQKKVQP